MSLRPLPAAAGPLLLTLTMLTSCASDPGSSTASNASEDELVCVMETATGSNFKVRKCWTREQAAQHERDVRTMSDSFSRTRPEAPKR